MADDRPAHEQLEQLLTHELQLAANMINSIFPEDWGFILQVFPYNDPVGNVLYVGSCEREDAIKNLRALLKKFEEDAENEGSDNSDT